MIILACKSNDRFQKQNNTKQSCGLEVSCKHIENEIHCIKTVSCSSSIDLDKMILNLKPRAVIIQAIWIEPVNLNYLIKMYPNIDFFVQIRSDLPFLAVEGNALDWMFQYRKSGAMIVTNSLKTQKSLEQILDTIYLPNIYAFPGLYKSRQPLKQIVNIACFGAIRPMKNHLEQAAAAIKYGYEMGKKIRFHINASRIEGSNNVYKNLKALFLNNPVHELVEAPWMDKEEKLSYISKMDLGMQLSMTETFNYVAADFAAVGVPILVSDSIQWASPWCIVNAGYNDISRKIKYILDESDGHVEENYHRLKEFSDESKQIWIKFLEEYK